MKSNECIFSKHWVTQLLLRSLGDHWNTVVDFWGNSDVANIPLGRFSVDTFSDFGSIWNSRGQRGKINKTTMLFLVNIEPRLKTCSISMFLFKVHE